ncbi:hypothetical protein HMPREF1155_0412 [Slackia sp. CM382]|uniref:IS3 family transposase n=1 Tax=Slackia sp. CM382 TaxID=1111137 RepID=UPI00027C6B38|nr:IS3 family transposase [Slackia sp. CM382]EJU34769.1 hypothetical protein HMPREF1155_0412 [Slackia sp. CM382]
MKAEMHYGIELRRASGLEAAIGAGVGFYNNKRITSKPEGMTIAEHRDALEKVSRKAS